MCVCVCVCVASAPVLSVNVALAKQVIVEPNFSGVENTLNQSGRGRKVTIYGTIIETNSVCTVSQKAIL